MVSPTQIQLVQTTWKKLLPIQNEAARLFYDRLFALDPSAKALFTSRDMRDERPTEAPKAAVAVGYSCAQRASRSGPSGGSCVRTAARKTSASSDTCTRPHSIMCASRRVRHAGVI